MDASAPTTGQRAEVLLLDTEVFALPPTYAIDYLLRAYGRDGVRQIVCDGKRHIKVRMDLIALADMVKDAQIQAQPTAASVTRLSAQSALDYFRRMASERRFAHRSEWAATLSGLV